jgi:hypothetical protein
MLIVQPCPLEAKLPCCTLPGPAARYQGACHPAALPVACCCWLRGLQAGSCLMQVLPAAASSLCGSGVQPLLLNPAVVVAAAAAVAGRCCLRELLQPRCCPDPH